MSALTRVWRYLRTGRDPSQSNVDERIDTATAEVNQLVVELRELNGLVKKGPRVKKRTS